MALQCLYATSMTGMGLESAAAFVVAEAQEVPSEETQAYCLALAESTLEKMAWADALIAEKLEHWALDRVTLIDRLILELALVEMVNFENVPLKVSISEAIEIAKRYSTDESPGFINGILDAVYHDILDGKLPGN